MVNFNVHWKGCPHRKFPRFHITRPIDSVFSSRCNSHVTGKQCGIPNCRALEQARRKQKLGARRRGSRASSSIVRSRKRALQRARQNIQVFGWESPHASLLTRDGQTSIIDDSFPTSTEATIGSGSTRLGELVDKDVPIDSVDGAAYSAFKRVKTRKAKELYSLMHVADAPVWKSRKFNHKNTATDSAARRQVGGEYAHVGPISQVSNPQTPIGIPGPIDRTYDSRILYKKYTPSTRSIQYSSGTSQTPRKRSQPRNDKAFLAASTLASLYEEATNDSLDGASRQTPTSGDPVKKENLDSFLEVSTLANFAQRKSFSNSIHSIVQSLASCPSSRSPSQRRALRRFTRELELYLQVARQVPKQTPISSAPSTVFSEETIKTIQELKPYRDEFKAAGLAVTSADQRRKTVPEVEAGLATTFVEQRRKTVPQVKSHRLGIAKPALTETPKPQRRRTLSNIKEIPQYTPPKDEMVVKSPNVLTKKSAMDRHQIEREKSAASVASDETVIEWTPDYELKNPMKLREVSPSRAPPLAPPPDEFSTNKSTAQRSTISKKPPPKKSLPWLRKFQAPAGPVPAYTTQTRSTHVVSKMAGDANASPPYSEFTSQPDSESSSIVLHLDTPPEHKRHTPSEHSETPKASTTPMTPMTPTTTPYPEPFMSPRDEDHIRVADFATSSYDPDQDRATTKDVAKPQYAPQIADQATQTSAAPSFTTRAPRSNAQIPSPFQRRGLMPKVPLNSLHHKVPQVANLAAPEPAPPHQISRFNSRLPHSPPRCTQCNVEIKESSSRFHANVVSAPESDVDVKPDHRRKNPRICEVSSIIQCEDCSLSMANAKTTKRSARPPMPRMVQLEDTITTSDNKSNIGSRGKEKEPAVVAEEVYYARQADVRVSEESTKQAPASDNVKNSSKSERTPNAKAEPPHNSSPTHVSYAPTIPILVNILPTALPLSDSSLSSQLASLESSSASQAMNKKLFKGLRVATAAACEEGVDKFIEDITGYRVRQLLMDLSAFDGLGVNTLADVARRTARKRRMELLAVDAEKGVDCKDKGKGRDIGDDDAEVASRWKGKGRAKEKNQSSRESEWEFEEQRKSQQSYAEEVADEEEEERAKHTDRRLGLVAGDQGVRLRKVGEDVYTGLGVSGSGKEKEKEKEKEDVLREMSRMKEGYRREGVRDRAVRMGWRERERTVSDE